MVTKFFNISTDGTLADNSNILVPSQRAVRNFIASKSVKLTYMQDTQPASANNGDKWFRTTNNLIYTYNSGWDNGIIPELDQFFTFEGQLYYYDGSSINEYATQTIVEQNQNAAVKIWVGTRQQYEQLTSFDSNTLYQVAEPGADYAKLASQTQFDNSSQLTAATPYQVNQKIGNYLPLAGGNLDAGAVLRLTNSNSEVTALAFNTSGQLTVSTDIYGDSQLNINSIVVRSGNIYKTNISGATALWSDSNISSTQLPTASTTDLGGVKIDGTTITINNGIISASGSGQLANTSSATNSLTILGTPATNAGAVNTGNGSSSGANSVSVGTNATALTNSVAIGSTNTTADKTEANATGAIAIGYKAKATANGAIQIGEGTNNTANTVQIGSTNILNSSNKLSSSIIPIADSNAVGGIMLEYDSTTNTLNIKTS